MPAGMHASQAGRLAEEDNSVQQHDTSLRSHHALSKLAKGALVGVHSSGIKLWQDGNTV